jgi:hypothetical protein
VTPLSIGEARSVQFPMVAHAAKIGWAPIAPAAAVEQRGSLDGMLFRDVVAAKLVEFNPWLPRDAALAIVETLEAIPPTVEGNREMLAWMRGDRQWHDEAEKRHRRITLVDFDRPGNNVLNVCMYLDKPMRDHVLLQAIARVNRPYVDGDGIKKEVGLVVDFVSVLRDLKKALRFDSEDVSGVIEDLDVLLADFKARMANAEREYLTPAPGTPDEQLEALVYGRFLDPAARRGFFEAYKAIEVLWEILSPSAELRDHITAYKRLATLYATVRHAYAAQMGFVADLAHKTRRLIEASAEQEGIGRLTRSITFDLSTLEPSRSPAISPPDRRRSRMPSSFMSCFTCGSRTTASCSRP